MRTDRIIAEREAGLISPREARRALRRLARQSRFNADYASNPAEYQEWQTEARRAAVAAS